ncbi:PREDICTED: uncharacterized protein LOC108748323 isoform X2 [Trachymyrmex septentrionalis]|uniref:uncharacterized protein LOC108748323 isoform X2 n=1 Tax=Trachymyrmex septentrionalis TaxID=34720 RepID=UPI00084F7612|nr:PREDICTED: uncharacterized protein LOC108748323 isoform X2 [Trachymyrmex septentrionalis]XP_018341886.1 PREDICTED: uncharacterized protein LOC108748323 isoform X2 [Trachymyrmex septentrionalis]
MIGSRFSGLSVCGIKPIHSISFTLEGVKKKWELIPLVLLNVCMMVVIPSMVYHRFFVSTIDIQPTAYQRFEIPSVPRFYDLRNPRSLKFDTRWHSLQIMSLESNTSGEEKEDRCREKAWCALPSGRGGIWWKRKGREGERPRHI